MLHIAGNICERGLRQRIADCASGVNAPAIYVDREGRKLNHSGGSLL